jgi:capsular polysaccharide biosynthesis protein
LESYFRHRWVYLLPVLVLSIVGGVYIFAREPEYLANGVVFVKQESFLAELTSVRDVGFSWNTPAQDVSEELTDLMQTDAFIRAIIQKTDLEADMDGGPSVVDEAIESVRTAIWAVPLGKNQILIGAATDDPQITYQLVNATMENFIQWKINSDRVESETALTFFQDLLDTYKTNLETAREDLRNYLIAHPEPVRGDRPDLEILEIERLQSELQVAGTRYSKTLDGVESARLALAQVESDATQTYIVVDQPVIPDKPEISRKDLAIELAIFIAVGVVLSVIGIGSGALLDRSFLFPVDIMNLTGLPVLASVPHVRVTADAKQKRKKDSKDFREARKSASSLHIASSPNGSLEVDMPEGQES